jgi:hypothetical protein
MTLALLVLISVMWLPCGLFFLGYGEAKTTGFVSGVVGLLVVIGAIIQTAQFADPFTGGLLFVFGVLYMQTAHALMSGAEDLRTVGNGALLVAIVCAIYCFLYTTGGAVKPDGSLLVAKVPYLAFMTGTFVAICLMVTGVAYGKVSGKLLGVTFVILSFTCLLAPAISLMAYGKLPF